MLQYYLPMLSMLLLLICSTLEILRQCTMNVHESMTQPERVANSTLTATMTAIRELASSESLPFGSSGIAGSGDEVWLGVRVSPV